MDTPTPSTTVWPPSRPRKATSINSNVSTPNSALAPATPLPRRLPAIPQTPSPSHAPPPQSSIRRYKGGYEVKNQAVSYTPYSLSSRGQRRREAFAFNDELRLSPLDPLSVICWNELAHQSAIIEPQWDLRPMQMDVANCVLERKGDVAVISETGSGKSLAWILPLLVQSRGISLVVTPYTSLGTEGETKCVFFSVISRFTIILMRTA